MTRLHRLFVLLAAMWLWGCGTSAPLAWTPTEPAETVTFTVLDDAEAGDPALEALIAPYATEMEAQISEVIGSAAEEIREGRPEGPLGTFAAEAMLSVVQRLVETPVDIALTNNGGLRVPLGPGLITIGKMFELMPFDNMMIVLDLSAAEVDSLAQQIARVGGDPLAGMSLVIDGDRARDVRVAGQPLDAHRTYRIVTSDYLANGGGPYDVLWGDVPRDEVAYLLRDAFTDHLRAIGSIDTRVDGLIRRNQ